MIVSGKEEESSEEEESSKEEKEITRVSLLLVAHEKTGHPFWVVPFSLLNVPPTSITHRNRTSDSDRVGMEPCACNSDVRRQKICRAEPTLALLKEALPSACGP